MNEAFKKNIGLMNIDMLNDLKSTLIILFGLGGVGGFAFEALLRAGIENFIIIDKDKFEITNLNRQLESNMDNIGLEKAIAYKKRALKINNNVNILDLVTNVSQDNIDEIFENINIFNNIKKVFVADCIDDVKAKICIIKKCHNENIKLISSMGTANHKKTKNIKITKLSKTEYCPLAKKIRNELKANKKINPTVLFIDEEPVNISVNVDKGVHVSTIQYVPASCGLRIAEYIINDLIFV